MVSIRLSSLRGQKSLTQRLGSCSNPSLAAAGHLWYSRHALEPRRNSVKAQKTPPGFWGHQSLGDHLLHSLETQTLPTVIIFAGPIGTGKAKGARQVIEYDRCSGPGAKRPCGVCKECLQIRRGTHPDVQIVTGQADDTISIETIRTALQAYQLKSTVPDRSRWLFIQNAEWLSPAAVSSLLKFLEEPPPLTRIILTTAHAELLPRAIRSRAAIYRWHLLSDGVVKNIDLPIEQQARAAGRPDWLTIDAEQEEESMQGIIDIFSGKPMPAAWLKLESDKAKKLLNLFELTGRDLLLHMTGASSRQLWPRKRETYDRLMKRIPAETLLSMMNRLQNRHRQLKHHVSPRLIIQDVLFYA